MPKSRYVIQPRLTLPTTIQRKRQWYHHALIFIQELIYLAIAGGLGNLAYWYLIPWPVYRIVAFVIIFILWSNVASETARYKTKKRTKSLLTMGTQAVQAVHIHHRKKAKKQGSLMINTVFTDDTTTFLAAIRKDMLRRRR